MEPLAEERRPFRFLSGLDWVLLLSVVSLTAIGLATVRSATVAMPGDLITRQAVWVGASLLVFLVAVLVDYNSLVSSAWAIYGIALALLVVVLFVGVGPGATRSWLAIGNLRIGQPAELAKGATLLLLVHYLAGIGRRYLHLGQIALATLIVAVPVGLIALQPDFGSAAMFAPLLAGCLLVAGIRLRVLVVSALVLALALGAVWTFGTQQYQRERIFTFLQPEKDPLGAGYQVQQSKIAVGSGEILGRGYMEGTQSQLRFLPALHTDFIFSVLAEEWGFLGVTVTLFLYGLFIVTALRIASRARDRAGILLIVGFLSLFSFHVLYNTAMVVGYLPITGIPLPFLSYGGSFMLLNYFGAGLILNVDIRRYVNR